MCRSITCVLHCAIARAEYVAAYFKYVHLRLSVYWLLCSAITLPCVFLHTRCCASPLHPTYPLYRSSYQGRLFLRAMKNGSYCGNGAHTAENNSGTTYMYRHTSTHLHTTHMFSTQPTLAQTHTYTAHTSDGHTPSNVLYSTLYASCASFQRLQLVSACPKS